MPLAYAYPDKYLAPLVTIDTETRAVDDVALLGAFPAAHTEKLVILRSCVLTCQECQRSPEDVFSAKLSTYRAEYKEALMNARSAQAALAVQAGTASAGSIFSVELFRG